MSNEHREGLWDPERPVKRKRALPKSRVSAALWVLLALVAATALLGVIF
ncbi:hypothetical protein [Corynebacterium phocae]|nr:hypothetical protein [Corynebacterium phocae]